MSVPSLTGLDRFHCICFSHRQIVSYFDKFTSEPTPVKLCPYSISYLYTYSTSFILVTVQFLHTLSIYLFFNLFICGTYLCLNIFIILPFASFSLHLSVIRLYIIYCLFFSFSFYLIAYTSVYLLLYCSWSSFIYLFILYIYLFIFALVLFIILFILSFSFIHSVFPFICQFQCCSLIYGIIVFLTLLSVVVVFCFCFYPFLFCLYFYLQYSFIHSHWPHALASVTSFLDIFEKDSCIRIVYCGVNISFARISCSCSMEQALTYLLYLSLPLSLTLSLHRSLTLSLSLHVSLTLSLHRSLNVCLSPQVSNSLSSQVSKCLSLSTGL